MYDKQAMERLVLALALDLKQRGERRKEESETPHKEAPPIKCEVLPFRRKTS